MKNKKENEKIDYSNPLDVLGEVVNKMEKANLSYFEAVGIIEEVKRIMANWVDSSCEDPECVMKK